MISDDEEEDKVCLLYAGNANTIYTNTLVVVGY
jgi:hypothetical protein